MKSFLKTASRAVAALFAVALVTMGVASPAFADDGAAAVTAGSITIEHDGKPTGVIYNDLKTATAAAESGDTILLGKGNYTLYGEKSEGLTEGKDLTFVGSGTDQTSWRIGPVTPKPIYYDKEYNGDYSFDGAGTVTFRNMTMLSTDKDYLGFIRINNTVLEDCVLTGKTFYWGYKTAVFKNTTFNPPTIDYALWTYCSPVMTFDNCTFNAPTGKVINVYTDGGTQNVTVNVNNCTFNSSDLLHKQALTINDSTMGNFKYTLNFTGNNTVTAARDKITCSQLFGFGGKESTNNKGKTDVNINGKLVWSGGKMQTHSYTDGEHDQAFGFAYTDWTSDGAGIWTRNVTKTCNYCGYTEGPTKEKAYDLAYDLNGSTDEQTAKFATVEHVTETEVTAEQPVRKGYSFVGWNTAKDGSGTSYAAGEKVELSAPVTLFAQWKKDEPASKPSDNKPSDNKPSDNKPSDNKPANKTKANKQALPKTGDASANIVAAMSIMAIACFVASVVVAKVRK